MKNKSKFEIRFLDIPVQYSWIKMKLKHKTILVQECCKGVIWTLICLSIWDKKFELSHDGVRSLISGLLIGILYRCIPRTERIRGSYATHRTTIECCGRLTSQPPPLPESYLEKLSLPFTVSTSRTFPLIQILQNKNNLSNNTQMNKHTTSYPHFTR